MAYPRETSASTLELRIDASQSRDLAVYLARLIRLDAQSLVRIKQVDGERIALWSWTGLEMLAMRGALAQLVGDTDITVSAQALLTAVRDQSTDLVSLPPRCDLQWRGGLPPVGGEVLEVLAPHDVQVVLTQAEATFRTVSAAAAIPQRAGQALLDHVAIRVESQGERAELSVRQLIAAARMGFLGQAPARVGRVGRWVFLAGEHGVIYRSEAASALVVQ